MVTGCRPFTETSDAPRGDCFSRVWRDRLAVRAWAWSWWVVLIGSVWSSHSQGQTIPPEPAPFESVLNPEALFDPSSRRRERFAADDSNGGIEFPSNGHSAAIAPKSIVDSARPPILNRPLQPPEELFVDQPSPDPYQPLTAYGVDAPLGFTGPSGVLPRASQEDSHFVPMEDRWRSGFPTWDRYDKGHPPVFDYPYVEGDILNPYDLNVLKGDYPVIGQHTFLKLTATTLSINEFRQLPTPTTPFESTEDPRQEDFFGNPNQFLTTNFFKFSMELFHGNAAFKPVDWAVRLTPIVNVNYLKVNELGIVNPDVRHGDDRFDDWMSLEEYFVEAKLADLSADFDFASMRIGSQPFTSDFRGFIFSDINRGVRLFGTRNANRDQFNLVFFDQVEKDTNSQLNTLRDRDQNTLIANYYRQDFVFPGYTANASFHWNHDGPSVKFDENDFLVRPDPTGVFKPHQVDAYYFGFAGEGHIEKVNIANAFYWVTGEDSINPIAGRHQTINACMAAVELSVDRDWVRFRGSFFYASGDDDPRDQTAKGFDTIFDNPNFAGGEFSFWQRQEIRLFGVGLTNRMSLVPDLRSSKFQGQSNFVNPGLLLYNVGMDFEVTPKFRVITNCNYLLFDQTEVLEAFTFQDNIDKRIGIDLSIGSEYRPLLNDNIILEAGYAVLLPGAGFDDLFGQSDPADFNAFDSDKRDPLHMAFLQLALTY